MLIVVGDDHATCGESLFGLRIAELADCQRGWDGHDAGGDEGLGVDAEGDVSEENGPGDGGEAGAHDLVDFGLGEVGDERADEHGGFALADEGGGGCYDCFCARDA